MVWIQTRDLRREYNHTCWCGTGKFRHVNLGSFEARGSNKRTLKESVNYSAQFLKLLFEPRMGTSGTSISIWHHKTVERNKRGSTFVLRYVKEKSITCPRNPPYFFLFLKLHTFFFFFFFFFFVIFETRVPFPGYESSGVRQTGNKPAIFLRRRIEDLRTVLVGYIFYGDS